MKLLLASIATGALLAAAGVAQPRYSIIDLGTLPGATSSSANYLNDNRLVGGNAANPSGTQQAVFWAGPFRINIGTPGLNSGIFGINASGQASISGEISTKDPYNENFCAWGTGLVCPAFLWQRGALTQLPTLGGYNATLGNINAKGEIPGAAETGTRDPDCPTQPTVAGTGPQFFDYEAVVWGPNPGTIRELKPLPGDTVGIALWINDNSQAVGASGTCANTVLPPLALGPHAVIWNPDGSVQDLGNLGSKVINMALGINNKGQVTGVSSLNDKASPAQGHDAFLWTGAAGMQDLGTLPGDVASVGANINDAGDVVGASLDGDGNPRGFLWHNGAMRDLNDLAVSSRLFLLWGSAINSREEIVGFGATEKGDVHGYLAVPANGAASSAEQAHVVLSDDTRRTIRQHLPLRWPGVPTVKPQ